MLGLMLRDCCLVILIIGAGHAHTRACVWETKENLRCWLLPSTLFVFKWLAHERLRILSPCAMVRSSGSAIMC